MSHLFGKQARTLLVLLTVSAVAIAACSGGSKGTAVPSGAAPASVSAGASSNVGGVGLSGAANKLSDISSYKFSMTLAGGSFGSMLGALGGAGATGNEFTISGTIVSKPTKAADITIGTMRIIEVGGNDYMDLTGSGTFMSTPATGSSMADSFAPASMFSSMIGSSMTGFNKVGTESKNGVSADHYQGTQAALSQLNSAAGVTAATWTADLWIAAEGGYPVSMAYIGLGADQTLVYEIKFDISNVNGADNAVTAPKV